MPEKNVVIPPKKPGNGKVKIITDKEIEKRIERIRKDYIKKIDEINKKDKPK